MTALARALFAAPLIGLFVASTAAASQSPPLHARVVWVRADRVYVASLDSTGLEPGERMTFLSRGKRIAVGEISHLVDRDLAVVILSSGSLPAGKKLERVKIVSERSAIRPVPLLRVGYPARGRSCLFFSCDGATIRPPESAGYRADSWSERTTRLLRDSATVGGIPWPDTLVVRLFDEAADEEIALERGELDVAVFWPGELSAHLRQQPRWQDPPFGTRSHGVVVAIGPPEPNPAVRAALAPANFASFNQVLFRGDLAPCGKEPVNAASTPASETSPLGGTVRFEVDSLCPGRPALERFLNRGEAAATRRESLPRVRVGYFESRPGAAEIRSGSVSCLFAIRCPIVCSPNLRAYVNALGAGDLADLLDCAPTRLEP